MKKLLFTLAALFMVGTAVADDYWYIEDFEVPQSAVNTNITVTVKAHFDNAVSAAQIDFTLPEGMVLRKIDRGTDFNITYHDDWGDEWPAEQTVFVGATATANVGWAFADMDYYEVDGTWVEAGSVKFMPGEYQNQIVLTIRVTTDFQGGKINVHSEPSCTYDNRPDVVPCPEGQKIDKECNVTLEGATPQLEDLTGHIVFSEVNQEDGSFTVSYDGPEEDVAVEVISIVEKTRDGNKLPDYGTYTVTAKASKTGYNDLEESADLTWNAPTPQTAQPTVTYEETEDGYLVTVTGDGVLTLVVDDVEVVLNENNQYLIPYTNTPEGDEHTVVATAQVPGELVSDPKVVDIQDPGQTPKPSVTYT